MSEDADNKTDCQPPELGALEDTESAPTEVGYSWAVSLCFWSALLLSAVVYGTVATAPKFAVWNRVRHEYRNNAEELVSLDSEVEYLERVASALETDPEFVDRLAGQAGLVKSDEEFEMIPVSGNLLFGYDDSSTAPSSGATPEPPFNQLATTLATNRKLRSGLLIFSASLTIFAFTFLNDAGEKLVHTAGRLVRSAAAWPLKRYVTTKPDSSDSATPQEAEPVPPSPET